MRPASPRVIAFAVAATLALTSVVPAAIAVVPEPVLGDVQINGGAATTTQAIVTVSIPATNAVSMRLSNNGVLSKTMAWAPTTTWDLTDPAYGGTSAIGWKSVSVQVDDGTDSWGPWDSGGDSILFDNQGPTESMMRVSIEPDRQVTSGGGVTMRVNWLNDDHQQSGTQSYDIETRTDGGAWTPLATHPALPGYFQMVASGHTFQARVRGHDYAGNVGNWYEGPAVTDDRLPGVEHQVHADGPVDQRRELRVLGRPREVEPDRRREGDDQGHGPDDRPRRTHGSGAWVGRDLRERHAGGDRQSAVLDGRVPARGLDEVVPDIRHPDRDLQGPERAGRRLGRHRRRHQRELTTRRATRSTSRPPRRRAEPRVSPPGSGCTRGRCCRPDRHS